MSIVASSLVHYGVVLGFGRHTGVVAAEFGQERLFKTARFQMLGYPFNIAAFSLPNIAITILIVHLLDPNPRRTYLLYSMTISQVVFACITIIIAFSQCSPTKKLWEKTVPGSCWSPDVLNDFSYWFCAYTTFTDVMLAMIPISTFWQLQMPRSARVGLCVMMGMTMPSAVVTIIKGTYLPLFTDETDPLYNPAPLVISGLVEQNIVIIAACIPTMRPFFHTSRKSGTGTARSHPGSNSLIKHNVTERDQGSHRGYATHEAVSLDELNERGDAASRESQQGIVRAIDVNISWSKCSDAESDCTADQPRQSKRADFVGAGALQ